MRDDPTVVALVTHARKGDQRAWDEIIERYAPLVWSICRHYRLDRPDIDDVAQSVWLRLVEQLDALRDPAALPGWLATTTRRECLRVSQAVRRQENTERPLDFEMTTDDDTALIEQELLAAERNAALRTAFGQLHPQCRRLLSMLLQDPPVPYADISACLHMAVGSIGPVRARCLAKLRLSPALVSYLNADSGDEG